MGEPCSENDIRLFIDEFNHDSRYKFILLPYCDSNEMQYLIDEVRNLESYKDLYEPEWTDDRIINGIVTCMTASCDIFRDWTETSLLGDFPICIKNEFIRKIYKQRFFYKFKDVESRELTYWYVSSKFTICIDKLSPEMKNELTVNNNNSSYFGYCFNMFLSKPDFHTTMKLLSNIQNIIVDDDIQSTKLIISEKHIKSFINKLLLSVCSDLDNNHKISKAKYIINNNLMIVPDSTEEEQYFNWFELSENLNYNNCSPKFTHEDDFNQFFKHYYDPETLRTKRKERLNAALENNDITNLKVLFIKHIVNNYKKYYYKEILHKDSFMETSLTKTRLSFTKSVLEHNAADLIKLYCYLFSVSVIDNFFIHTITNNFSDDHMSIKFIYDMLILPFYNWNSEHRNIRINPRIGFSDDMQCPIDINHISIFVEEWLKNNPYEDNLEMIYTSTQFDYLLRYKEFNLMINKLKLQINFVKREK